VLFSGQSFVQLQHAVVVGGVGKEAQEIAWKAAYSGSTLRMNQNSVFSPQGEVGLYSAFNFALIISCLLILLPSERWSSTLFSWTLLFYVSPTSTVLTSAGNDWLNLCMFHSHHPVWGHFL
jgi:hypothetical protein